MNYDIAFLKTGPLDKMFRSRPLDGPDASTRAHAHAHTHATGSVAARRPTGRAHLAGVTVLSIDGTIVAVFSSIF